MPGVSYPDALAVALCYGWIDGQKARLDDEYWLQRFTPRKPGSRWSKINTEKAAELIEAGRMQPAGLREVERARADGRWDAAYDGQRAMGVPDDLAARAGRQRGRARVLRDPVRREPVRDPVPDRRRQAAGDPRPADREVRGDAGRARDDPPAGLTALSPRLLRRVSRPAGAPGGGAGWS